MTAIRITTLTTILLISGISAYGQERVRTSIPFDFEIAEKVMPAGEYEVHFAENAVVHVRSLDGSAAALALTNSASRRHGEKAEGKLVFLDSGFRPVLSEIWRPARATGQRLLRSKPSREGSGVAAALRVITVAAR